jgi:Family of unknown function (DUF5906)
MAPLSNPPSGTRSADGAIGLEDFYAVPSSNQFLFMPTRELWPGASVNGILPMVLMPYKRNGKWVMLKPHAWLKQFRRVEQLTWVPGLPEIIEDRLIFDGGWQQRQGAHALNLYRPPHIGVGDACQASQWVEHIKMLYPDDVGHILDWLGHRVQHPDQKPNHALVLGGGQGIGKDTLLAPIKYAVGPWNFQDISPTNLLEPFNPFVKAVVLRMNEAHDLGESERTNRFALYERVKIYAATPPEVLRCNEKHLRQYYVPNVLGLIITTNHKSDGVYLPSDDRRHFIAWSHRSKEEFSAEYFNELWSWLLYENGNAHVAAYLAQRDLSAFNPCALPRQTPAFFDIVNAGRSPEDAELADVLDELGQPEICTLLMLAASNTGAVLEWLLDRRHRRSLPHRLERCGYIACRNPDAEDGLWKINRRRQTLYVKASLTSEQRLQAAQNFMLGNTKVAGSS